MIRERGESLHVQVYAGRDPLTGKKRYKSKIIRGTGRASWKEARVAEGDLLKEVEGRKHKAPKSFTVAQLLDQWLEWRETNGKEISPSTLYNYRLTIATKIKPGLGHMAVAEVDARILDRFYAALRKSGNARFPIVENGASESAGSPQAGEKAAGEEQIKARSPRSRPKAAENKKRGGGPLSASRVRDVHAIMSGALGLAARWGYIPFNPAILASPPAHRSAPRATPTATEAQAFLKAAAEESTEFEIYVRIGATTGLRRGEICALRWSDVDLKAFELKVSGNVLYLSGLENGYLRKDPKSGNSERVIALDTRTVKLLKAHHAHCAERALAAGATLPASAFLFAREADGSRPVRPDAMTRRFKEIAESLGHPLTLHGLRHFVATELGAVAEAGTVKSRLGHGSLAVSSIYTHRVSKADRDAAKHMGKVLDGRPARSRQRPKTG